jgi:CheY-like chemotaxis protein
MPGMDGYQATAQIRRDPLFSAARLPIIAMTAHALEDDRRKSLEAGLNDYVSKPVDVTNLANVLLRWVHSEPAAAVISQASDAHAIPAVDPGDLPASLESIDMVAALARRGDNKILYRKLLLMFHAEHSRDVHAIRSALQAEDIELASLLAHSLKGLAGTIGADELRAAAKDLEMAIAQGNTQVFETNFVIVIKSLNSAGYISMSRFANSFGDNPGLGNP